MAVFYYKSCTASPNSKAMTSTNKSSIYVHQKRLPGRRPSTRTSIQPHSMMIEWLHSNLSLPLFPFTSLSQYLFLIPFPPPSSLICSYFSLLFKAFSDFLFPFFLICKFKLWENFAKGAKIATPAFFINRRENTRIFKCL